MTYQQPLTRVGSEKQKNPTSQKHDKLHEVVSEEILAGCDEWSPIKRSYIQLHLQGGCPHVFP